ncbi:hypothetical protein NG799_27350 [Laspinema sp. D1]|uniref:Uncharacterized protein n=1 Tax=Laspinema palackyanum D2a TaxID=2953684 RepID=A0ABT2MZ48_9CYAN|nr:hypothetical protein [Laspinema sp. D2a]
MQHIKTLLPPVIPGGITPQNPSLHGVIENAIASSQIRIDSLPYAVQWHIPLQKYSQAQPFIQELTGPAGGNNATLSNGSWWNPVTKNWVSEPIVLVKSAMTGDVLQRHLPTMLQNSYRMGRALAEQAIALEILTNNMMLIIPTA